MSEGNEALIHLKAAEDHMDEALKEIAVVLIQRCPGTFYVSDFYLRRAKIAFDKLYDARDEMRRS